MADAFAKEMAEILNELVIVEIVNGDKITGKLKAFDPKTFSIILEDVAVEGEVYKKLVISGNNIARLYLKEKKVDMEKLKEEIEKYFPKLVDYKKEIGVIMVMNRVRVTDKGVEGPPGPATEKVKKIFEEFMKGYKASQA
ncbi:hypothetical protein DRN86_01705 [Candidatus Geothermarchaeota archaeon]|nr:MAG: hypothetical protein DRN86_01705 [Candidatus Geothermarchaeota archaeon]